MELTTGFTTDETALTTEDGSGYYSDYESLLPADDMCDKSGVRAFRAQYEPPLFWMIFVLGALGNLMVVWIYSTMRNRLKTMTDVYLLNLAVADLLFLGTLPFWAADAAALGWQFGTPLCKVVSAVYRINFFASMLLLTCISVDRYVAIVQVTKAHNLKKKRLFYSKLACLGVWLVSALLALPEFTFAQARGQQDRLSCSLVHSNHTKVAVLSLQVCVGFCLPLLVMALCYSVIVHTLLQARSFEKHKALRVVFAVVAVFVLSQLPYNGLLVMEAAQASNATITTDCGVEKRLDFAGQVAKTLAYTHACVNPFLYVFVGVRFRKDLVTVVKRCAGGLGAKDDGFGQSQATPKRPSVMSDTETTPALSL